MKKDNYYRRSPVKRYAAPRVRRRFYILGAILSVSLMCAGFLIHSRQETNQTAGLVASFTRLKAWFAERKSHLHENLTKVKALAATKPEDQPIHFEFYNTLPNMQVSVTETVVPRAATVANVNPKATNPASKIEDTEAHLADKTVVRKESKAHAVSIASHEELEKELSLKVQPSFYFVQVGLFKNLDSAEKARESLLESGFTGVMKVASENSFYRVQLGPFSDNEKAKAAQKQLQKKGMNGLIRKVSLG